MLPKKTSFAISLQYLKKEVSDVVHFLHADKHESLPQIDTMISIGMIKHSQSSQIAKFPMFLWYLKKEDSQMKLIFSMQINIKVSYKLI